MSGRPSTHLRKTPAEAHANVSIPLAGSVVSSSSAMGCTHFVKSVLQAVARVAAGIVQLRNTRDVDEWPASAEAGKLNENESGTLNVPAWRHFASGRLGRFARDCVSTRPLDSQCIRRQYTYCLSQMTCSHQGDGDRSRRYEQREGTVPEYVELMNRSAHCDVANSKNGESRRACRSRRRGVWQSVLRQSIRWTTSRGRTIRDRICGTLPSSSRRDDW